MDEEKYESLGDVVNLLYDAQFVLAIVGICFTVPHLIISTRKNMRASNINPLIVGIAVCDLIVLFWMLVDRTRAILFVYDACYNDLTLLSDMLLNASNASRETFTRCSFWLGVSLALIRLIIIKTNKNRKVFSNASIGSIVLVLTINFLITLNYYVHLQYTDVDSWTPPEECHGYPANYSEGIYVAYVTSSEKKNHFGPYEVYELAEGISQVAVSVIYPILAILLYWQIRKAAESSRSFNERVASDRARTSRMVLLMTVCYVVASAPHGIVLLLQITIDPASDLAFLLNYGYVLFPVLFAINAIAQCVIYFATSSEYRKTVRRLLGIEDVRTHNQ